MRGLSPYPTAWATLGDKTLKVFKSGLVDEYPINLEKLKGIASDEKSFLIYKCEQGAIAFEEVQLKGKSGRNIAVLLQIF